ncbi:MAG: 2-hydroxyacid dehydrogenase, partial [Hyphomicrobiaceae bacterium]
MTKAPLLLVTMDASPSIRTVIQSTVGNAANVVYLSDLTEDARAEELNRAEILLSLNTDKELRPGEAKSLEKARLIQFVSAGIDFITLARFPASVVIAGNGGGYAEPMAEHAVMMALAAYKRLLIEHHNLAAGAFNQFQPNRMLAGSNCGVLGFGGIGKATARLMRSLGCSIYAVNRSGETDEPVDWIASTDRLHELLDLADILVVSVPLTPATHKLIGRTELNRMKRDAVLINLARGEIVNENDLYAHLRDRPGFTACIDAWWVEPVRHGEFRMDHDFMSLPNVIASPHNSASVAGWRKTAVRRAVENCCRVL